MNQSLFKKMGKCILNRAFVAISRIYPISGVLLFLFLFLQEANAQYPYLKTELKTNLVKITCLDDFEIEAKQVNWQFLRDSVQDLLFWKLQFVSPTNGYALASVWGAAGVQYLYKTTDGGKSWHLDPKLKQLYVNQIQFFGKDSIVLLAKKTSDWYVIERYRYFSKDAGQTWDSLRTNIPTEPVVTSFLNYRNGFGVDENNIFYTSADGGISWSARGEVAVGNKKKLLARNTDNIFLLNDNGLTQTRDGGKTWTKVQLPVEYGFTDLCMTSNIGFISGRMGRILKTEDGGQTWKIVNSKIFPQLSKIGMMSKDSVWAVGQLGTILYTSDGGVTWQQQYADNRNDLYELNIFDHKTIFAGGMYGVFSFHKPEILGNYKWGPANLILQTQSNLALALSANDEHFFVSAQDSKGNTYKDSLLVDIDPAGLFISSDSVADAGSRIRLHALTDAGTWTLQNEDFTMGVYHDVEQAGQDTLFVVGQCEDTGVMLKSTDNGKSWYHVTSKIEFRLDDIQFVNSKVAYACGYKGYLIKTIDGGGRWEKLNSPTEEHIKSISFLNENVGYIAADRGQVFKTTNGGQSWTKIILNYDFAMKILFLDEQKGFLLHNYSGFLKTLDGGETWQEVQHDKFFDVTDITFVNPDIGYATGGILSPFLYLKTIDGGRKWTEKIYPRWTQTTYQTISFKDEYSGFVFNQIGEVIFTGDGGQNWFILDTLKFNEPNTYGSYGFPVNAFKFVNKNTGIGVGNGQIVRYEFSPQIGYAWSPETKVEGKTTAHPNVPSYLAQTYTGSISRDLSCKNSAIVRLPQLNVYSPSISLSPVSIYPQPSSGQLFVKFSEFSDFEYVNIYSGSGILLYTRDIRGNSGIVEIHPELNSGIYILEIYGKKQKIRRKVSFL
jgi:Uncharacterized protein related to plant photosystem II stability/assembly factor